MSHLAGMSHRGALLDYTSWVTGLPETIDGTTGEPTPEYRAKPIAHWQQALDDVRNYLGDEADAEARALFASEQARIDALR